MANPSQTLAQQLSWIQLLPTMGISVTTRVLPQSFPCPVCAQGQLTIERDQVLHAEWGHCQRCGFAGDMIELAAACWRLDVPATFARLQSIGFFSEPLASTELESYLADHVEYRRRINEFWVAAQRAACNPSSAARYLMRQLGVLYEDASTWPRRMGQFVGTATRKQIEDLFHPGSYQEQERANRNGRHSVRRGGGPGGNRLFVGDGWDELVVVPFYDLPGRICAFLLIGRSGDPHAGDLIFKRVNLGCTSLPQREAGVGMLAALRAPPMQELDDKVFVIGDPRVGLILQARRLREHERPLPIVLSCHSPDILTQELPSQLKERKLILWGPGRELLIMAKRWNARVSDYRISPDEITRRLAHHDPVGWLCLIEKKARPWQEVLRRELDRLDLESCESLLKSLDFTAAELQQFALGCGYTLRERIAACDPNRVSRRRVVIGGKQILETPCGWEIAKTGEQIANMAVRIEEVLTSSTSGAYYRGTATQGAESYRYTVTTADVDRRGLLPCVRDFLLERQTAFLSFSPRWAKKSTNVAVAFHEPRVSSQATRIGWNQDRDCFQFPEFSLGLAGIVVRDGTPATIDEQTPGRHLRPPEPMAMRHIESLSVESPETSLVWALAACVAHNVLAPVCFRGPVGIILDGESEQAVGRLAAMALGCAEFPQRRCRVRTLLEQIESVCSQHDWPAIIRLSDGTHPRIQADWVDSPGPHNAILLLGRRAALGLAAHPGFVRVRSPVELQPLGGLQDAAAAILPNYIQYVIKRRMLVERVAKHSILDVLADMTVWFSQFFGKPEAVRAAGALLSIGDVSPWASLVGLAMFMVERGELNAIRHDRESIYKRRLLAVYFDAAENHPRFVWIPVHGINQALTRRHVLSLDLPKVQQSLESAGAWLGAAPHRGQEGWRIDGDWWDEQVVNSRKVDRPVEELNRRVLTVQ